MTSILTEWGKRCVEKLIKGAIEEARFVFCFTCIAKEFEEERARLEPERITLGQRVKVAKGRNKDIQANVVFWEEEVDKLIQEDTKTKKSCFFGFCPDCIWRYKKGKELANNMEKIKGEIEKGKQLEIGLARPPPGVERNSSQDYISFKSRESEYKELLDALKDDNNYITGLQGMGGTGKTTLAKVVGKELKESGQFTHVIDTTISFTPDIKKIQDEIAGPLGLKWEDCTESDRPKTLLDRLTNGDKILLIMDDVWDQDPLLDFEAIGIPKRDNHKGCRVLVTTRSKQISSKMNFDKSIELGLLSKEDAWIMFQSYAGITNGSLKHVTDKGRKIAKECKQLPVAIAVIARSLKGQQHRVHEWDVTLKSLKKHIPIHGVDDDMVGIYKCLKFSYDHMKHEKAKRLFLLCSVFPEDEEISVENLTRLCIGAGLFEEDYENYDDARNQVVVAKNKLIDSCLLLEVGEKSVKMHDLVRDAAQWIAKKEILGVNLSNKNQKSLIERETNIRCLLCEGNNMDLFSCKFDGSKLETLIVKVDRDEGLVCMEVPNSFFENICGVRVLHFTSDFYQQLSLQHSIHLLTNIRSLLVDKFDLGDISVLGNLQSLETLDLVRCIINELPNEITNLKEFKLLSLKNCRIRMNNPFEVIERCPSLEELYFMNSFNNFCGEITLPELQRYHICNGEDLFLHDSLSKCVDFRADGKNFLSKGTLNYFMRTAKFVRLYGMKEEWRNLIPDIVPIDHGMNDLVELHLVCISGLQFLINNIGSQVPIVLSKLVMLVLFDMKDLVMLFNGPISFDSLKNLEILSITYCNQMQWLFKCKLNFCNLKNITLVGCRMLVSLFQLSTSQSLVQLETLEIGFCDGLKKIVDETRDEESIQEEIDDGTKSHGSMFPKLKDLYIVGCPLLEYIFPFISSQGLPELEKITLRSCDGLKYIFCQYQYVNLGSLRQLDLCGLPNFIDIFQEYNHPNPMSSSCVRGSSSTSKAEKELDPIKCNIFSWTHMCCDGDQPPQDYNSELKSFGFDKWERPQCLSKIMCNIKEIKLDNVGQYHTTFPILAHLQLNECFQVAKKSIGHFTTNHSVARSMDGKIMKKLSENMVEHFLALEKLMIENSKVECIFYLNEVNKHKMNLGLQDIDLFNLPMMTCLFVGPKNSYALENLDMLKIVKCEKLEIVFSTAIVRCLPQLRSLIIKQCKELKHIIKDDVENEKGSNNLSSRTSFPMLDSLDIINCNKLKCVFPISESKELPMLRNLMIKEADELEEIFKSEGDDQKVVIPNLNVVAFVNLPSLFETQGIHFQAVENRFVRNCQKFSADMMISNTDRIKFSSDIVLNKEFHNLIRQIRLESKSNDTRNENPSSETTKDFAAEIEVQATSGLELTSSQGSEVSVEEGNTSIYGKTLTSSTHLELGSSSSGPIVTFEHKSSSQIKMKQTPEVEHEFVENVPDLQKPSMALLPRISEELMNEQPTSPLRETYATVKSSQLEGSASEKTEAATISTNLETKTEPLAQSVAPKQKGILINVEDGTISNNVKTLTSSTHSKSISSSSGPLATSECETSSLVLYGDGQTALDSPPIAITRTLSLTTQEVDVGNWHESSNTNDDQVSLTPFEDVDLPDSQETTKSNDIQVSLNDDAFLKVSSNVEDQFPKDDEIIISKSKPIVSQFPSFPSKDFDLYLHMESIYRQFQEVSKGHSNGNENPSAQTTQEFAAWFEAEAASRHKLTSSQELMNEQNPLGEIDTTIKPSQGTNLEGSTSEKLAGATLSTISGTINEPPIQLVAPKQKGNEISFVEGTTSNCDKTVKSSAHVEVGDGKICIPSSSIVNIKPPATKDVDIGDSQKNIAMEELIEEDPLLALEKLLTGVQSFSIETLLQELKTLMDSVSDLDHLVSNQESKEKLISLFHGLNQHEGLLPYDVKEFVEKVQNFFNDNIIYHATSQQVLKKHNQLLDSKTDLMNKLLSAKSKQTHIDNEASTANAQIHELSLQIDELRKKLADLEIQRDDLKSVVNQCDVQKKKLKAECSEWVQQSKELLSALASSEVNAKEIKRARILAKEGFANLKSLFPKF